MVEWSFHPSLFAGEPSWIEALCHRELLATAAQWLRLWKEALFEVKAGLEARTLIWIAHSISNPLELPSCHNSSSASPTTLSKLRTFSSLQKNMISKFSGARPQEKISGNPATDGLNIALLAQARFED